MPPQVRLFEGRAEVAAALEFAEEQCVAEPRAGGGGGGAVARWRFGQRARARWVGFRKWLSETF